MKWLGHLVRMQNDLPAAQAYICQDRDQEKNQEKDGYCVKETCPKLDFCNYLNMKENYSWYLTAQVGDKRRRLASIEHSRYLFF
jgi:hypothetical protein